MYLDLTSDMALFTLIFCWSSMMSVCLLLLYNIEDFLLQLVLFCESLFYEVVYCIVLSHRFRFCPSICFFVKRNRFCHFLRVFFNPGIGGQVRFTLSWSITVHPYLIGLCILIFFPVFSQLMWISIGSTVIFSFWGSMQEK